MSAAPYDVSALIKEIISSGDRLQDGKEKEDARQQCLAAARTLCYALETPRDYVFRLNYAEVDPASTLATRC